MSIKEGKKPRKPVRDCIRSKREKEEQEVQNTKHQNLEEKVVKEKSDSIKNMN